MLSALSADVAQAYALPVAPSSDAAASVDASSTAGPAQNYNFNNSLQNLISPFQNFFNSVKVTGNIPFNINTGSNTSPNISIGVDYQQYINQFNTWFYGATGVQIQGLTSGVVSFFSWVFAAANAAVNWIAGLAHK
jgi:hypothetical protein